MLIFRLSTFIYNLLFLLVICFHFSIAFLTATSFVWITYPGSSSLDSFNGSLSDSRYWGISLSASGGPYLPFLKIWTLSVHLVFLFSCFFLVYVFIIPRSFNLSTHFLNYFCIFYLCFVVVVFIYFLFVFFSNILSI